MTLLELGTEHRGAFEYDWRARFGRRFDLDDRGDWTWGELWRVTQVLAGDPSSQLAASLNGWPNPVSREFMVAADLYDVFVAANSKKGRRAKPYPRPWLDPGRKKYGRATRSQRDIRAALAARGH